MSCLLIYVAGAISVEYGGTDHQTAVIGTADGSILKLQADSSDLSNVQVSTLAVVVWHVDRSISSADDLLQDVCGGFVSCLSWHRNMQHA